jgi:hypothetical protein
VSRIAQEHHEKDRNMMNINLAKIVVSSILFLNLAFLSLASAKEIKTNSIHTTTAPDWVTDSRIDRVASRIQQSLEWDIRRVEVVWHNDEKEFEAFHKLGPTVLAISKRADNSVHIGPRVNNENFDGVFGHEMSHIISFQKYKGAIPDWLEEGVANFVSKAGVVDYQYLNKHEPPKDVHELTHPFNGSVDHIHYHYIASQALAEMLNAKCNGLSNLLRLSVGRSVEQYLEKYCDIKDLNASFKKWVSSKSGS